MARKTQAPKKRFPPWRSPRRWIACGTLALVGFLYYQPLRSFFETREQVALRAAEVEALQVKRRSLERRLRRQTTESELLRAARELGYVRPGERLYIIKGIASWRRALARERAAGRSE